MHGMASCQCNIQYSVRPELRPLWICQITGMGFDQSCLKPSSKKPCPEFPLLIYANADDRRYRHGEKCDSQKCSRDAQSCLNQNSFHYECVHISLKLLSHAERNYKSVLKFPHSSWKNLQFPFIDFCPHLRSLLATKLHTLYVEVLDYSSFVKHLNNLIQKQDVNFDH